MAKWKGSGWGNASKLLSVSKRAKTWAPGRLKWGRKMCSERMPGHSGSSYDLLSVAPPHRSLSLSHRTRCRPAFHLLQFTPLWVNLNLLPQFAPINWAVNHNRLGHTQAPAKGCLWPGMEGRHVHGRLSRDYSQLSHALKSWTAVWHIQGHQTAADHR